MSPYTKPPTTTQSQQLQATRELKHQVLTCLHKLSDRDTYTSASSELEAIIKTLSAATLPLYLYAVAATDAADKSPVKRQCLRLITLLSEHHGNLLAPYLSKLVHLIIRSLRDMDSNVRVGCVKATGAVAMHLSKVPFGLVVKPFLEALFTEQEVGAQMGAAMCLSAAVEGAAEVDVGVLRKVLPRLEKAVRCEGFKAKAALLGLIGSVIGVGGVGGNLRGLVGCLVEFVGSKEWAVRKATAEALRRLAVVEMEVLGEFKGGCLKIFEAKRYDKVKAVRETMNQMVEAWKAIPDLSDEVSAPPDSNSSSKEVTSNGRYPPGGSKISHSGAPHVRQKSVLNGKAIPSRKNILPESTAGKTSPAMFRKLDHKKPFDKKLDLSAAYSPPEDIVSEDYLRGRYERGLENCLNDRERPSKPETRRALFSKNSDENMQTFVVSKAGSRVVPCSENMSESIVSNEVEDLSKKPKESEDLSSIRQQLVQIETQQSSLLDLLQRFMGRSENGMQSLESRVHGLELALDEISYDLAVSTGRMSNNHSAGHLCCKLPGTDFFSSKLFKRTGVLPSTARLLGTGRTPPAPQQNLAQNEDGEVVKLHTRRNQIQGGHGIIVNPLAKLRSNSQGISEASSSRVPTL